MGGNSSALRLKSRSTTDVDRIRPSAEQRQARIVPKRKGKLSSLAAASTRHFAKISFKRKTGSRDKIRTFRDLVSSWPLEDAESLFREMDAMRQLAELSDEASCARPSTSKIGVQLLESETKTLKLTLQGDSFPVHSRFWRVRSGLLSRTASPDASVVEMTSPLEGITAEQLREFIKYVYTEECDMDLTVFEKLKDVFQIERSLKEDLKTLETTADDEGDFIILLSSASTSHETDKQLVLPDFTVRLDSEIVGARSSLFASLVRRKQGDKVVLDEGLLPRSLIPLIVHFLYTDELDLSLISSSSVCVSSLSEARAIVSGQNPESALHQASQIVHVAKFFGLQRLVQLCEDVIVSSLSVESVVPILSWAEDGGSQYVAHMARQYLILEFSRVAVTHHLFYITLGQLENVVASHFLQTTEVEVLEAAVRWGEHELLKRMESREPNIVADTSHSISRRGIRRTETSDAELREILEPISAHIRCDYILPPFHQSLTAAYRRGLLDRSPLKDLVVCSSTAEINPDLHWFCPDPHAVGPRFYRPYFEALCSYLKSAKEEATSSGRSGNSYASTTVRSSESGVASPLKVIVSNAQPELLDDVAFRATRERIVDAVAQADARFAIRFMPRPFHRKVAVECVATRVLREMEVDANAVEVRVAEWADSQGSSSTTSSVRVHLHSSQPALHWPDIMTLERRKKVMLEEERGNEEHIEMIDGESDSNSVYHI